MKRSFLALTGAACLVLAVYVFFHGNLTMPTRTYPALFHFFGIARYLLSMSLAIFGAVSLGVAIGRLAVESRAVQWAVGIGVVLLGIAFISAPRY